VPVKSSTHPIGDDARAISHALAEAIAAARHAPSIHHTQPWRWSQIDDGLDLHLERARVLDVVDPDARFATLSCGAALHHARVSLAALGWRATVSRIAGSVDPDHIARIQLTDRAPTPVEPLVLHRAQTIRLRRTDRRPLTGPLNHLDSIRTIAIAVDAEGAGLHVMSPDQLLDVTAAAGRVPSAEPNKPAWLAELEYWTGATHPADGGRTSGRAAVFGILNGRTDEPTDWLRAGEALSAGWLTATENGVGVLPLRAAIAMAGTRQAMQALLGGRYPYLVLRLGGVDMYDPGAPRPPTP
jgi:nitroreductase